MILFNWKRWLFLTHRWLGITVALMVTAWFASGMVMMYVPFPELTTLERRSGQPTLDFSSSRLSPLAAAASAGLPADAWPVSIRFAMHLDRPVYHFGSNGAVVFADTGARLGVAGSPEATLDAATATTTNAAINAAINATTAAAVAADFHARRTAAPAPAIAGIESIEFDQWSLSGAFQRHRPLYRVSLADPAGHHYYVSSQSAEVLLDTSRRERLFNYVGAVTHWIYPTLLTRHAALWTWIVQILATVAVVMTVAGLWIGWLQWKRKRAPGRRAVPYRGLARWHYFAGVIFGVPALAWSFSGLLSMNPGNINPWRAPAAVERAVTAGSLDRQQVAHFSTLLTQFPADAVGAQTLYIDGEPRLLVMHRDGQRSQLDPEGHGLEAPPATELERRLGTLMPGYLPVIERLTAYDNYYKPRRHVTESPPLPMLRLRYADADATWFHVDPFTGQILEHMTATNRLYRWLYQGLHSWDYLWLVERRPLWDLVVIVLCAGGLALSLFGVVLGSRRLFGQRSSVGSDTANAALDTPSGEAAASTRDGAQRSNW